MRRGRREAGLVREERGSREKKINMLIAPPRLFLRVAHACVHDTHGHDEQAEEEGSDRGGNRGRRGAGKRGIKRK